VYTTRLQAEVWTGMVQEFEHVNQDDVKEHMAKSQSLLEVESKRTKSEVGTQL
jgi:hypothetical protein